MTVMSKSCYNCRLQYIHLQTIKFQSAT